MTVIKRCCMRAIVLALALYYSEHALASTISISRYQTVPINARYQQIHLLEQTLEIRFPSSVQTIGQAIDFSLQFTGYHLVSRPQLSRSMRATLHLLLPVINRTLGPITLKELLQTLVGPAFSLVIDPAHRLVSFKIKPTYH